MFLEGFDSFPFEGEGKFGVSSLKYKYRESQFDKKKRRKMQKWKTYMRAVLSEQKKKTKKKREL